MGKEEEEKNQQETIIYEKPETPVAQCAKQQVERISISARVPMSNAETCTDVGGRWW